MPTRRRLTRPRWTLPRTQEGKGLIKINGTPLSLYGTPVLRGKLYEPILLLQQFVSSTTSLGSPLERVDIRLRVSGGGHTSQLYALRQAIGKAVVAYVAKYEDAASALEIRKVLVAYDRTLLVADPRRVRFGALGIRLPGPSADWHYASNSASRRSSAERVRAPVSRSRTYLAPDALLPLWLGGSRSLCAMQLPLIDCRCCRSVGSRFWKPSFSGGGSEERLGQGYLERAAAADESRKRRGARLRGYLWPPRRLRFSTCVLSFPPPLPPLVSLSPSPLLALLCGYPSFPFSPTSILLERRQTLFPNFGGAEGDFGRETSPSLSLTLSVLPARPRFAQPGYESDAAAPSCCTSACCTRTGADPARSAAPLEPVDFTRFRT